MITPKTDWTSDDYHNAEDLNRVEYNTQFVAEFLENIGYTIPLDTVITNRTIDYIDFISSINRVEQNLDSIRENFITPPGYEPMKTWTNKMGFSYKDANRLENNLELLYEWAKNVYENLKYCGTFYAGEEGEIY